MNQKYLDLLISWTKRELDLIELYKDNDKKLLIDLLLKMATRDIKALDRVHNVEYDKVRNHYNKIKYDEDWIFDKN